MKICVFNFTNDDLCEVVINRFQAGVDVRVITDDECQNNKGSDVSFLASKGIPVRTDSSPEAHMHNKFVIIDDVFVMTGSFNWTF